MSLGSMLFMNHTLLALMASCMCVGLSAQEKLTMTRAKMDTSEVHIKLKRIVRIETADSVYRAHLIKGVTEEGFVLWHHHTIADTSVVPAYLGSGADTTIITERHVADSIVVPFSSITALRTSPLMNSRWAQSFAWFAVPAALGLVVLPIGLIAEGSAFWTPWLAAEGAALALAFHPLPLHLFDRRYRATEGWRVGPHGP